MKNEWRPVVYDGSVEHGIKSPYRTNGKCEILYFKNKINNIIIREALLEDIKNIEDAAPYKHKGAARSQIERKEVNYPNMLIVFESITHKFIGFAEIVTLEGSPTFGRARLHFKNINIRDTCADRVVKSLISLCNEHRIYDSLSVLTPDLSEQFLIYQTPFYQKNSKVS